MGPHPREKLHFSATTKVHDTQKLCNAGARITENILTQKIMNSISISQEALSVSWSHTVAGNVGNFYRMWLTFHRNSIPDLLEYQYEIVYKMTSSDLIMEFQTICSWLRNESTWTDGGECNGYILFI